MTDKVKMIALRSFPRMEGQAIIRMKEGDFFSEEAGRVPALEKSGKAKKVMPKPKPKPKKSKITGD